MALPQFQPQTQKDPITLERERIAEVISGIPVRIGVHAGKGGVGKTFVSAQLALSLAAAGKNVGLVDADVDCPNIPEALNLEAQLEIAQDGRLIPVPHNGVQVVSTGFMQPDEPIIIRGPIKHRLLTDFLEKTVWDVEALIIDFPPGTSDVPLSAMQVASLTGIILVTTATKSSIRDCRRAAQMTKKIGVPVLGVVENMAGETFGEGAGEHLAKELNVPFIARIPLRAEIRERADKGELAIRKETQEAFLRII